MGYAEKSLPSEEEISLLELINEARKNPLAIAASLGMDPGKILNDLPELYDVLTGGLPPLAFNEMLYAAALGHTEEMIAYAYYAQTSVDGRTYVERIKESGYVAAACGESLGIVAFRNLVAPVQAIDIIFKSIFLAELDPETTAERNILNSNRTEAGIAFGSGRFTSGVALNAYLTTLDFGKPLTDAEAIEKTLAGMINRARHAPNIALLDAAINLSSAAEAYREFGSVLSKPLPPLAWNEKLHGTAAAHNRDMRDQDYYSRFSPDGTAPFDRVAATGYDPFYVGESLAKLSVKVDVMEHESVSDIARQLYEQMLTQDVDPASDADRNIFNPFVTEIGISVEIILPTTDEGGHQGSAIYVVVADVPEPLKKKSFVVGNVYKGYNSTGVVDEYEGILGVNLILEAEDGTGSTQTVKTRSGPAGHYQIDLSTLPTGFMELYAEWEGEVLGPFSFVHAEAGVNVFRNIRIEAEPKQIENSVAGQTNMIKKGLTDSYKLCY